MCNRYTECDYFLGVNVTRLQVIFRERSIRNPDYIAGQMCELRRLQAYKQLSLVEKIRVQTQIETIVYG